MCWFIPCKLPLELTELYLSKHVSLPFLRNIASKGAHLFAKSRGFAAGCVCCLQADTAEHILLKNTNWT